MIIREKRTNYRSRVCNCNKFAYASSLVLFQNSSEMVKLVAIRKPAPLKEKYGGE